jgi:hypothetical protein
LYASLTKEKLEVGEKKFKQVENLPKQKWKNITLFFL